MSVQLKINGIYDLRTLEFLKKDNINSFGFDFNPTSLNFIPGHAFKEILAKDYNRKTNYFLYYKNQKCFVLNNTVSDVLNAIQIPKNEISNIFFELEDVETQIVSELDFPFFLHVKTKEDLEAYKNLKNLKGIVVNFSSFESMKNHEHIFKYLDQIFKIKENSNLKIHLKLDWNSNIISSIFDFFSFDSFDLPINSNIEICYRNVNLNLLHKSVETIKLNLMA